MDDKVRAQYEAHPYPPRDPADEAKRLITGSPSHILEIDHYLFAGRRDFSRPFRALIAGGGTGDAAIMLAQQLKDAGGPGEVVYLDVSRAAAEIAAARAAVRGLDNIRFVEASLTALDRLGLGTFDYIDCCGVLHHLEDAAAGLRALAGALADDGGMGVMVYAPLGRTGVYHVQAMLRLLDAGPDDRTATGRIATARALLGQLPPTNWLRRNPHVGDHLLAGDAGLVDLLLHARDRAYTVPEVAALARAGGLRIVAFIEPARYDPRLYLRDPAILARLERMGWIERCTFAELLVGNLKTHVFYAVKAAHAADTVARADSPGWVPVAPDLDGPAMAEAARPGGVLKAELDGLRLAFPMPALAPAMLRLIDGVRSLGEIHAAIAAETSPPPDWAGFKRDFDRLLGVLGSLNLMFLRHK